MWVRSQRVQQLHDGGDDAGIKHLGGMCNIALKGKAGQCVETGVGNGLIRVDEQLGDSSQEGGQRGALLMMAGRTGTRVSS